MRRYINFSFENIEYDEKFYRARFSCRDLGVECEFRYNRITREIDVWENTQPVEEILPIPIYWLDLKLMKNGMLRAKEYKISY